VRQEVQTTNSTQKTRDGLEVHDSGGTLVVEPNNQFLGEPEPGLRNPTSQKRVELGYPSSRESLPVRLRADEAVGSFASRDCS
jgi:hypothetical protein